MASAALGVMARWLSISAALRRISSTRLDSLDTCGVARPPCCRESEKASAPGAWLKGNGREIWQKLGFDEHLGVSTIWGTPKWMVYNGKPYKNGWFGGTPIFGNIHFGAFWHIPSHLRLESSEDHQLEGERPASPGCSLHTH